MLNKISKFLIFTLLVISIRAVNLYSNDSIINPGRISSNDNYIVVSERDEVKSGIYVFNKNNPSSKIDYFPCSTVQDYTLINNYLYIFSGKNLITAQLQANGKINKRSDLIGAFKSFSVISTGSSRKSDSELKIGDELEYGSIVTFAGKRSFYTRAVNPRLLAVYGTKLFVLNGNKLLLFSLEDKDNPIQEKKIDLKRKAVKLEIHDDTLYIRYSRGMDSINLRRLDKLKSLSAFKHVPSFYPLIFYKDFAILSMLPEKGGNGEVRIYSLSEIEDGSSSAITEVKVNTPTGLAVYNGYLFITAGSLGLKIYHFDGYTLSDYSSLYLSKKETAKGYYHLKYRKDDGARKIPNVYFDVLVKGQKLIINSYYGIYHYSLKNIDNYKLPFISKIKVSR